MYFMGPWTYLEDMKVEAGELREGRGEETGKGVRVNYTHLQKMSQGNLSFCTIERERERDPLPDPSDF